jgi:hypothetical protein
LLAVELCPSGDDLLTDNLNQRSVTITIQSTLNQGLSGTLIIQYLGSNIMLPLSAPTNAKCKAAFEASQDVGSVLCSYKYISANAQQFLLSFTSMPPIDGSDNLYFDSGTLSSSDFTCDVSRLTVPGVACTVALTQTSDIKGVFD